METAVRSHSHSLLFCEVERPIDSINVVADHSVVLDVADPERIHYLELRVTVE